MEEHDPNYYRCLLCKEEYIIDTKSTMLRHMRLEHMDKLPKGTGWSKCGKYIAELTEKDLTPTQRKNMELRRYKRERKRAAFNNNLKGTDKNSGKKSGIRASNQKAICM